MALAGSGVKVPQTLVSVHGQIGAFAQDGNRIAWVSSSPRCRDAVEVRNVATGKRFRLATRRGATCRSWTRMDTSPMLAIAGPRALWGRYQKGSTSQVLTLIAGGLGRRDRVVAQLESERGPGAPTVAAAGDGTTLVYRWSGVNRVVGARPVSIAGTHPIAFLAAAGADVAFARYLGSDYNADARWSSNGKTIAFTSSHEYGNPSLYVVNPTGRGLMSLTGASYVTTPAWPPTGDTLAYVASAGATSSLWTINPKTRVRRKLAVDVVPGMQPAWAPTGYALAFTRRVAAGNSIYTVTAAGGGERLLALGSEPAWSPDATRVVFTGPTGVSVADANGTGFESLALGGRSPSFSPDGTRIAFERRGDIWVMNADGRGQRQLTTGGHDLLPVWSPGGTRIAFERGEPRLPYVVATDGSGLWKVSSTGASGKLDWSPDAARIVFAGKGGLVVAQADGSGSRRIPLGVRSRIEVRNARTGRLQTSIVAAGRAQAIALSRSIVAVLADRRLSVYARASGSRVVTRRLPRGVASELSAAGRNVVFRTGRTIWLSGPHGLRRLALADATPVGLSIEGRRVAWAENVSGRGRIRAVFLP